MDIGGYWQGCSSVNVQHSLGLGDTTLLADESSLLVTSMIPEPTTLPGLADELVNRLNENVATSTATTITTRAMIRSREFLAIHDNRSWVVGAVATGSSDRGSGVGVVDMGAPPRGGLRP